MDSISPVEEKLLAVLGQEQLITKNQETRLLANMKRGMSLREAVARTPIVDPVKFTTIEALSAHKSSEQVPMPQEPSKPLRDFIPIQSGDEDVALEIDEDIPDELDLGGESFRLENLGPVKESGNSDGEEDLDDLDPDLELDFMEFQTEDFSEEAEAGTIEREPVDRSEFDSLDIEDLEPHDASSLSMDDIELPEANIDIVDAPTERRRIESKDSTEGVPLLRCKAEPAPGDLHPPADREEYVPWASLPQEFHLTNDEGIPLIGEVNGIIGEAIMNECAALECDLESENAMLRFYDAGGQKTEERPVSREKVQKYINRIKVMARMETWRQGQAQKGMCYVKTRRDRYEVLVDQKARPDGLELLTLYFIPE